MSELNICQRVNAVMNECEYLQKKQAQQGKGILYDEVMAMIRELLVKHGIVMVVRQTDMECLSNVGDTKQKIYQGRYEMDLINIDKPDEKLTHSAFAHGMDGGDKAAGKAHTYAVKLMLVKGFGIETGVDEESRAEKLEKLNTISIEQQEDIAAIIDGDDILWKKAAAKYAIRHLRELPNAKFDEFKQGCVDYKTKAKRKTAGSK